MRIEIKTQEYNPARFGVPYIAVANDRSITSWGKWEGEKGEAGVLWIEAEIGDVIMVGQKDYKPPINRKSYGATPPELIWHTVGLQGELILCLNKSQAFIMRKNVIASLGDGDPHKETDIDMPLDTINDTIYLYDPTASEYDESNDIPTAP